MPGPVVTGAWFPVCRFEELRPERGVGACVGGRHLALFRTRDDRLYALVDGSPSRVAEALSLGTVRSWGCVPTVTPPPPPTTPTTPTPPVPPARRHVFDLRTGSCLDDPRRHLATVPVRVVDGAVEVAL